MLACRYLVRLDQTKRNPKVTRTLCETVSEWKTDQFSYYMACSLAFLFSLWGSTVSVNGWDDYKKVKFTGFSFYNSWMGYDAVCLALSLCLLYHMLCFKGEEDVYYTVRV